MVNQQEERNVSWKIQQFGPTTIPSPLDSVLWVDDDDVLLLNPVLHLERRAGGAANVVDSANKHDEKLVNFSDVPTPAIQLAGPRKMLYYDPATTIAAVLTCGGICPGLNDVIRGLANVLWYRYGVKRILGVKWGFAGLNKATSEIVELTPDYVRDIHKFGGTILGSSRGPQSVPKMVDYLVELGVNLLFTIGGDGTQKGAQAICNEVIRRNNESKGFNHRLSVVGIPKTIDNDIAFMDRTFGFETAVELAQSAVNAAHEEARSALNGIGVVKLMGRESGYIALHASIASGNVDVVLIPEVKFTMEGLVEHVLQKFKSSRHCVIVVAEGAGQDVCTPPNSSKQFDVSGNPVFVDIGPWLAKDLGRRLKDLRVPHTIKLIDPSYTIRSAPASASDAAFALELSHMAAHAAMAGKTNCVVGQVNGTFVHLPVDRAVQYRKRVDVKKSLVYQAFLDQSGMPSNLVEAVVVRPQTPKTHSKL
ncbi:diphosphate--fructose-6-phosphate 1-phosphotransferase [Cladochytrium replicatum]|nr:diphosphate--fructose-6-phosphate 1-phosphotransferase [Cladochytrium replicatum]